MLFELRHYQCLPGQRDNFVRVMEEEIIPYEIKCGMVIIGTFTADKDENGYYWIRRFQDETERRRLYKAVYGSNQWKNEYDARLREMLDYSSIKVTQLTPTAKSVLQ